MLDVDVVVQSQDVMAPPYGVVRSLHLTPPTLCCQTELAFQLSRKTAPQTYANSREDILDA